MSGGQQAGNGRSAYIVPTRICKFGAAFIFVQTQGEIGLVLLLSKGCANLRTLCLFASASSFGTRELKNGSSGCLEAILVVTFIGSNFHAYDFSLALVFHCDRLAKL
jgi:hypothetical protein